MRRKILLTSGVFGVLLVILYWELLTYAVGQASGQIHILRRARPVTEVLIDPTIPDSIKQKVQLIQDVRSFAIEDLGLKNSSNYTTYYDQEGKVALWNLSACEPFAFEPKRWSFPFLGSFPYKGYFDLAKAKKEFEMLKSQGYDVRLRPVGGWSTLGWTKDPILSNMLERSTGSIAELIIHELTHSTIFIKDDIQFNENLASFIGEQGTIQFLIEKYGESSNELSQYVSNEKDSQKFRDQMLRGAVILDSLYESFIDTTSDSIRSFQKHILIDQIISNLDTIQFNDLRYCKVFSSARPNNAYFMSYLRYYSSGDSLHNLLNTKYDGSLKALVDSMKEYYN